MRNRNSNCDKCGKEITGEQHSFAGWCFYICYHPECCPREVDGSECGGDHPEPEDKSCQTPK